MRAFGFGQSGGSSGGGGGGVTTGTGTANTLCKYTGAAAIANAASFHDTGALATVQSAPSDGGNACVMGSTTTLTSGTLVLWKNNATTKASLDYAGVLTITGLIVGSVEIDPSSPSSGHLLTYNGTKFVSAAPTSAITGSGAANRIAYWTSSTALSSDGGLTYDGTTLTCSDALVASGSITLSGTVQTGVTFLKEVDHALTVTASTTAESNGGGLAITTAKGGVGGSSGNGAGSGGTIDLTCGPGGNGTSTDLGGIGGDFNIVTGAGGTSAMSGGGNTSGSMLVIIGDGTVGAASGECRFNLGKAGPADSTVPGGNSGGFYVVGSQGGANGATQVAGIGSPISLAAGSGGNSSGAAAGGAGGTFDLSSGTGTKTGVGGAFTVTGGNGGAASTAGAGGIGGAISITCGTGGANSATFASGAGAALALKAGNGGAAASAAAGGVGGAITVTAGNGTKAAAGGAISLIPGSSASGTAGVVNIGTTVASAVTVGRSGITTTVAGTFSSQKISDNGTTIALTTDCTLTTAKQITVGAVALLITAVDKINIANLAIASMATGDTFYASSATALVRLGAGASGTIYTIAGGVPTWAAPALSISGTPADNQITIWTGASTIEGDANFTWDGTDFNPGGTAASKTMTLSGAAATSGATLKDSNILRFVPHYWNGSVSTAYTMQLYGVMDSTTPTASFCFYAGGNQVLRIKQNGRIMSGSIDTVTKVYSPDDSSAFLRLDDGSGGQFYAQGQTKYLTADSTGFTLGGGAVFASADDNYDLGKSTVRWFDFYLSSVAFLQATAATGGSQLNNSAMVRFRAKYWNGSASVNRDLELLHVPTATTPVSKLSIRLNTSEVAYITDAGLLGWISGNTAGTASAGAGGVLPITVEGYAIIDVAGTARKVAYYPT